MTNNTSGIYLEESLGQGYEPAEKWTRNLQTLGKLVDTIIGLVISKVIRL